MNFRRIRKALLQTVLMSMVASLLMFVLSHRTAAWIVYSLAGFFFISSIMVPRLYDAIDRFGQFLGRMVGIGLTWILMVPFYYIFFTIGHLMIVVLRKDPMHRKWERTAGSYWSAVRSAEGKEDYQRQF